MNANHAIMRSQYGQTRNNRTDAQKPRLVVALDVPDSSQALTLAEQLAGLPLWIKIGLELFTSEGPQLIKAVREREFPIFLDLKFHDIPNTVKGAVYSATTLGVEMCTVHASGGENMCLAAADGRKEALANLEIKSPAASAGPLLMAVTVLTSQGGDQRELSALVVERALMAKRCGLDGVVCSGHEAAAVKNACGKNFLCLCPGIRFAGAQDTDKGDQTRVCTPAQAVATGVDFLVMGRPITRACNPAEAARRALDEIG